jgi:hypothetical protein
MSTSVVPWRRVEKGRAESPGPARPHASLLCLFNSLSDRKTFAEIWLIATLDQMENSSRALPVILPGRMQGSELFFTRFVLR